MAAEGNPAPPRPARGRVPPRASAQHGATLCVVQRRAWPACTSPGARRGRAIRSRTALVSPRRRQQGRSLGAAAVVEVERGVLRGPAPGQRVPSSSASRSQPPRAAQRGGAITTEQAQGTYWARRCAASAALQAPMSRCVLPLPVAPERNTQDAPSTSAARCTRAVATPLAPTWKPVEALLCGPAPAQRKLLHQSPGRDRGRQRPARPRPVRRRRRASASTCPCPAA